MALTREQILAVDDRRMEEVRVPEWGGSVWVRSLTGAEADAMALCEFESGLTGKDALADYNARMVAKCACDEGGNPLFTLDDVAALGKKSAGALGRIVEVAHRLNGIGKSDLEAVQKN